MKIRVYELAKELNMDSKELVLRLETRGMGVKNYMSTLDETAAALAREIATENRIANVIRRRRKNVDTFAGSETTKTEEICEQRNEKSICRQLFEESKLAVSDNVKKIVSIEKAESKPKHEKPTVRRKSKDDKGDFSEESSESGSANEAGVTTPQTPNGKPFLIDGLNVCFSCTDRRSKVSLESLLMLLLELRRQERSFVCFFDANAFFRFRDDGTERSHIVYNKLIDRFPKQFCKVPAGKKADDFILLRAHKSGNKIISNDQFKQYADKYPWVRNGEKLIKGGVLSGHLMFPDLKIDIPLRADLDTMFEELKAGLI